MQNDKRRDAIKSGVAPISRPDLAQHAQLLQLSPEGCGGLFLLVRLNEMQRNGYPAALAVLSDNDERGCVGSQNLALANIFSGIEISLISPSVAATRR